ncbi:N-glycosylase [Candidatus Woesearchaeota archaeon CG10_big_fil_rev_8_21_14_0_10_34_12]|nr:MAG: N-glycosylase [Candidatus Woesearchaeota archaeon CG10_big_fil_rev_8_21_14_0_10_34_12]
MNSLILLIENLKNSPIKQVVDKRLKEFSSIPRDFDSLFKELVFCILTAGASAELGIKTINHLGDTIIHGNQEDIQKKLKEVYRFHTIRAGYIFNARDEFKQLDINHPEIRLILVDKIKGIGMKEASHFLRNIGFKDYAIVDFHIVDILAEHGLIEKPKTLTPKKYLEIEEVLRELAKETNLTLGELDLYLWYKETGKVLK